MKTSSLHLSLSLSFQSPAIQRGLPCHKCRQVSIIIVSRLRQVCLCVCVLNTSVDVCTCTLCMCVYIRFKYYERWASAQEFPFQNIVNDGSTTLENRYIHVHTYAVCRLVHAQYLDQRLLLTVWEPLLI